MNLWGLENKRTMPVHWSFFCFYEYWNRSRNNFDTICFITTIHEAKGLIAL